MAWRLAFVTLTFGCITSALWAAANNIKLEGCNTETAPACWGLAQSQCGDRQCTKYVCDGDQPNAIREGARVPEGWNFFTATYHFTPNCGTQYELVPTNPGDDKCEWIPGPPFGYCDCSDYGGAYHATIDTCAYITGGTPCP